MSGPSSRDVICAAESGDIHRLREALGHVDPKDLWAMHCALQSCAEQGWRDGLAMLWRKCSASAHGDAFFDAARNGHMNCLQFMAKHMKDDDFTRALIGAVSGRHHECISFLLPLSHLDGALEVMIEDQSEAVDVLAPRLTRDQLGRIRHFLPDSDLPLIDQHIQAIDDARRLENRTTPAPAASRSSRL